MNIHFNDEALLCQLNNNTVLSKEFGSTLYKLSNDSSDKDVINIYLEDETTRRSFMFEHHQLQFIDKEENDHIFVTLQTFIRNTLTGDSLINYELIQSGLFDNDKFYVFHEILTNHSSTKIVRAFAGRANTDYKQLMKRDLIRNQKKLYHLLRTSIQAHQIFNGRFDLSFSDNMLSDSEKDYEILKQAKNNGFSIEEITLLADKALGIAKDIREKITNNKDFCQFLAVDKMMALDEAIKNIEKENISNIDYGDLFYDALEFGVSY